MKGLKNVINLFIYFLSYHLDLTVKELDVKNLMMVKSLAVYSKYIYWLDYKSRTLNRVDRSTGRDHELIQGDIKEPSDVIIVDKYSFDGE